jgi:hypothetical protein
MEERKVRAWDLIEEDDGSTTMIVEYTDGGRDEFRRVELTEIGPPQHGDANGIVSVPISFTLTKP